MIGPRIDEERRRDPRVAIETPVVLEAGDRMIAGITADLSTVGIAVLACDALDPGTEVTVRVRVAGYGAAATGRVVRCESVDSALWRHRIGIAIDALLHELAQAERPRILVA